MIHIIGEVAMSIKHVIKRVMYQIQGEAPLSCIKRGNLGTLYIIRRLGKDGGFFSNWLYVLGHIRYARKKGYIPFVDMANYPTLYNEEYRINNTNNCWEYYFKQPVKMNLQDVYGGGIE